MLERFGLARFSHYDSVLVVQNALKQPLCCMERKCEPRKHKLKWIYSLANNAEIVRGNAQTLNMTLINN